eukprot:6195609-Pleurochrysis_carterae.AAC.3
MHRTPTRQVAHPNPHEVSSWDLTLQKILPHIDGACRGCSAGTNALLLHVLGDLLLPTSCASVTKCVLWVCSTA